MVSRIQNNLRQCWKTLVVTDLVFRALAFALLFPAASLLFRLFVWTSGRTVLADTDIAQFALHPTGWACAILVGGSLAAIYAMQLAGMMSVCLTTEHRATAHTLAALRFVAMRARHIFQLTSRVVAYSLALALPFVAVGGLAYWALLTSKDINFYLTAKPAEFWIAAVIIGASLLAMLGVLVWRLTTWALALPLVLFENLEAQQSLSESVTRVRGHQHRIAMGFVAWLGFNVIVGSSFSAAVIWMAQQFAGIVIDSMWILTLYVGVTLLAVSLVNYATNALANITFASWLMFWFADLSKDQDWRLPESVRWDRWLQFQITPRRLVLAFVAGLLVAGGLGIAAFESIQLEDHVEITAHRGGALIGPENTLATIQRAIEAEADWIEIDVQESLDGVVVVAHDSDLSKVARNPVKIWNATMEELKGIDIGSYFGQEFSDQRVPTLDEVLELCAGRVGVNIELKYYGHDQDLERKVVALVEDHAMEEDVVIMSLKKAGIEKIKALRPNWTVGLLTAVAIGDLSRADADFLAVSKSLATRDFVARVHSRDKWVAAWTVNDPYEMSALISRGVDNLITDDPAMAKRVLALRADMNPIQRLAVELADDLGVSSANQMQPVAD